MLDIITYIFLLWVGYQLGKLVTIVQAKFLINELKGKGISLEKYVDPEPSVYKLEVEEVDGMLYLYDRENNEFVCQGKTVEELAELSLKYKKIKYAAVLHNINVYSFVEGKIESKA